MFLVLFLLSRLTTGITIAAVWLNTALTASPHRPFHNHYGMLITAQNNDVTRADCNRPIAL